jgi:hypothetical protein
VGEELRERIHRGDLLDEIGKPFVGDLHIGSARTSLEALRKSR